MPETNNILVELSKYHTEWIKMVKSLGGNSYSKDIVQEMYLRIHTKQYNVYNDKGEINKFYIYLTLRSIFGAYFRQKQKVIKVNIEQYKHLIDDTNIDEQKAFYKLSKRVEKETKKWHWFDKRLFDIYMNEGKSIRKIAQGTTISSTSIFNTLKACKSKIRDNLQKDYEDYKKSK